MSSSVPPFDPAWLDLLVEQLASPRQRRPEVEDVYLEQTLELELAASGAGLRPRECRSEGSAVRRRHGHRTVVAAATGTSPSVLAALLGTPAGGPPSAAVRVAPAAELQPPRDWQPWAAQVLARLPAGRGRVRFRHRRAVLVRRDGWRTVTTPPVVRIEAAGDDPVAVLAVWGDPRLGTWLTIAGEPPPAKPLAPSPGDRLPVVFADGTAGVLMHELVGHMVEGDLVASGVSPLAGLQGALLTAPTVQLTDDPTRSDLPGAFSCDDEGVPARPLPLLVDGCLAGWLCDRATAEQLAAPAGRGRRAWWSRPPAARMSNQILAPGTTPAAELERGLRHGLVVTRLAGATVDPATGHALLRVERGWEVRSGRRRRPLARCELIGGVVAVLAAIDPALGDDPTPDWRLGWCAKHGDTLPTGSSAPTVLVRSLEVL